MTFARIGLSFALAASIVGCGGGGDVTTPSDSGATARDGGGGVTDTGTPPTMRDGGSRADWPTTIGGSERPAPVAIPDAYDGTTPLPLVILLHGYTASAAIQDAYFHLSEYARTAGFFVVLPDGTQNPAGVRFWNATPFCCDLYRSGIDDVAYLTGLVHEMKSLFAIDASRVYFVGHSNGGFMSYRMACELSEEVTAIASLAGSDFVSETECVPARPVSVLEIHGTADTVIQYAGTPLYPGAEPVVARWAGRASCDTSMRTPIESIDLDSALPGAETQVSRFEDGCGTGLDAELWRIEGGAHVPALAPDFAARVWTWLSRHAR